MLKVTGACISEEDNSRIEFKPEPSKPIKKMKQSKRLYYMDILRLLCVTLVMFGHFVPVASFAKSIPLIINDHTQLPLLNAQGWDLWMFEVKLIQTFHTQTAILGVLMFFLITGYLITMMLDRYDRLGFIINRIFRIYPALICCTLIIGAFVYLTQGIKFSLSAYLGSMTLMFYYFRLPVVTGVLWTLVIETWFYLMACLIGKFDTFRLLAL